MQEDTSVEANHGVDSQSPVADRIDEVLQDQLFTLAAEAAFDAILIHEDGQIRFVNQTLVNLLGIPRGELLGKSVFNLIAPASRKEVARHFETGSSEPYEIEGIRRNGSRFFAQLRAKSLMVGGRNLRLAAIRDITEPKEKELALAKDNIDYQRGQAVLLDLLKNIDLPERMGLANISESAARALQVARVGVWMYESGGFVLRDLFDGHRNAHHDVPQLSAAEYPVYISLINSSRVLAVNDALHDARTHELAPGYLVPLGIGAMLDVPIWHRGKVAGILCHEHVGGPRVWTQAEKQIATSIADMVSIVLEGRDRRQAEAEVRGREENLRLITSQMPALVWTTDCDLRVTSAVGTGLPPFNMQPQQHAQQLFAVFQKRDSEHPLVRPQLDALAGQSVTYDGEWQGCFYQIHIEPFRDADGSIVGTIGLAQDITERKRTEIRQRILTAEANQREAELRSVLDHLLDSVMVHDNAGRLSMINESARKLFAAAGIELKIGMPLSAYMDALKLSQAGRPVLAHDLPVERVLRGETLVEEQFEFQFPNSSRSGVLQLSAGPIRDANGQIVGGVGVGRDVSERVEFTRMKDSFIRVTAHELKTPLTIMKGYAQALLQAKAEFPAGYRKMLEAIDSGSTRIVRLINDLLDVARSGTIEIKAETREVFDLDGLVRDTLQSQTLTSKQTLRFERDERVMVRGDRGRIEQVVTNLLQNASKYAPDESEICIQIYRQGDEAIVSIHDRGIGIPAEKQPYIFTRFFRAHADTPYDAGGMGVGLYISREIITKHGGRIWFTSQEGKGSTFAFALPVAGH